jgi:hypothetical protein
MGLGYDIVVLENWAQDKEEKVDIKKFEKLAEGVHCGNPGLAPLIGMRRREEERLTAMSERA